ncbi:hypothetical protein [Acerihabitans arboris]|uniref:Uncharacterized protein n=1 Tax=Acerihabitans arboris TaxID=2691583 RepID=A0A845SIE5_9GAMM|nr:hypothetical protein [Acerihabitans arboris]NDL64680.1 hypothetical protein [Acerihabitans arboris]
MAMGIIRILAAIVLVGASAQGATAASAPASTAPVAELKNGTPVAAVGGKMTLQLPADFVNQTREDANAQNTGVVVQLFANRAHPQAVGISEVRTVSGDANDTSDAAFNKMAQGALSGLKTQFKNVKKTGQTPVMVNKHKLLRIDSQQEMQGKAMLGTLLITPYQDRVVTIQVLTPDTAAGAHDALVSSILGTLAFH